MVLSRIAVNCDFETLIANPYLKAITRNVLFCLGFYATTKGFVFTRLIYFTLGRDLRALTRLLKTKYQVRQFRKNELTVPQVFKKWVKQCPDKVVLAYEDEEWTFKELDLFSNKIANIFLNSGLKAGDEVSLFMESRPEYIGIWLGLAKTGIVTALINTNQKKDTLLHSITTVNSKALIFGSELQDSIKEIKSNLRENSELQCFCYGNYDDKTFKVNDLKKLVEKCSGQEPSQYFKPKFTDRLLYIYTSGTTGLPKAVIIKHSRYLYLATAVKNLLCMGSNDTIYTSIPLYHMAGGVIGTGLCLVHGNSMAIRHKFSASKFWSDCVKYRCTVAQYVGELCRYLLCQPENKFEKLHKVTLMFGNGLRPSIWNKFQTRFNVKTIGEFYGASEGNANIVNIDNKEGSCGFISQILPWKMTDFFYPVSLIKVNEQTGTVIRGADGLCVRCKANETGEFVGKIIFDDPTRSFDGYLNSEATNRKIVRDVFAKGDAYFCSGDLLYFDEYGYVFFKDRTGDTFRWKGENVSTTEVEEIVAKILKLTDCVVFGVEIPGCEGRAGMLTVVDKNMSIVIPDLLNEMRKCLPNYAIPLFIRLTDEIEMTGTLKLAKVNLQKQGFNPTATKDPIFMLDPQQKKYIKLQKSKYEDVINGQIQF